MRTRKLGSAGPEISVIGYGAWEAGGMAWGPNPPDEQTVAAMTAAFDAGMNWVDTAEVYGGGRSEELVAQAVAGRDVLVFTKVAPRPAGSGFHAAGVRAGAEASLRRLRRDVIDVFQLHWPDPGVAVEETWEAMAGLVDDGLVRWIGVSNFSASLLERCERVRHVDSLQPHFSMLHGDGRDDLFVQCEAAGTGIVAYGPLAYGLLTGRFDETTTFSDDDWRSGKHGMRAYDELFAPAPFRRNLAVVEALRPLARRKGVALAQLALAWVVHQRGVTAAIAGSRSATHVRENAAAGDVALTPEDLEEVEAVLAGVGRRVAVGE
ncbi:MAG TPA: aldo/keto reductase [Acidimicrobiales bacterium]|nr:aldo/keto reductase [Acidimicrobiales bacterium]